MEVIDDLDHSKDHIEDKSNGDAEESCIIIEEDISTIQIDDTIVDTSKMFEEKQDTDESVLNTTDLNTEHSELALSEFQIVDEVGNSEGDQETAISNVDEATSETNKETDLAVSKVR